MQHSERGGFWAAPSSSIVLDAGRCDTQTMWPLEYADTEPAYKVPDVYYFYTAEPNLKLDITSVYDRKLAALAQHRSQFPPAVGHYEPAGPAPSRKDLEALIEPLTGGLRSETFRHR